MTQEWLLRVLVASAWQGAAVGLIALMISQAFKRAEQRYAVLYSGLLLMILLPLLTSGGQESLAVPRRLNDSSVRQWATILWLCGVLLASTRLLIGWAAVRRLLRRSMAPVPDGLAKAALDAAAAIGHRGGFVLRATQDAISPCAVGVWNVAIVLPLSMISTLSDDQVRAVIAHELAHVKRWDFLANVVQTLIESLLFFHPMVWWVSSRIRIEREHACDDMALRAGSDAREYASALVQVAMQQRVPLAAAASGGSLEDRIYRLMGKGRPAANLTAAILLALIAVPTVLLAKPHVERGITIDRSQMAPGWDMKVLKLEETSVLIQMTTPSGMKPLINQSLPSPVDARPKFSLESGAERAAYVIEGANGAYTIRPDGRQGKINPSR